MRLSANLGFLFRELPLADAIRAAASQGFGAVEMHWPYEHDAGLIAEVLAQTGLPLVSVNTRPGGDGEFGLAALPGREAQARAAIDEALAWAVRAGARKVHLMAGLASGEAAGRAFLDNIAYAADVAATAGVGLLVEPLNRRDVPGYFLGDLETTLEVIGNSGGAARLMFDCYHMGVAGVDILREVEAHLPVIGHVQFASVPDRAEPDHGDIDYASLLPAIERLGYDGFFGAEYRPATGSFAWMERLA